MTIDNTLGSHFRCQSIQKLQAISIQHPEDVLLGAFLVNQSPRILAATASRMTLIIIAKLTEKNFGNHVFYLYLLIYVY